ncbi:MAG: primosomal protein N' [Lentisphaeria bacterium]|nr:primosomal protein N' [Lentisphaeria bacterium]
MIAKVIIDLSLDKCFDYLIGAELEKTATIGMRVNVPFGNSLRRGFILDIQEKSDYPDLKKIHSLSQDGVKIPPALVKLGQWMGDYYCCSREQAIRTLLPGAVRSGKISNKLEKVYYITDTQKVADFIEQNSTKKTTQKRIKVLEFLLENGDSSAPILKIELGDVSNVIKTLLKDELIQVREEVVRADIFGGRKTVRNSPLPPSPAQEKALDLVGKILNGEVPKKPILLHGVTNSGKTEVYLQAIQKAIDKNLQSIVLVPEISLTPQTVRRFRARFGDDISVLHSRLSDRERFDEWMRIREQQVKIVVGARSALFAPFENLGLIIVDEEHESSYKQAEAPRYHARDVAVMRGAMENAAVILGSATPAAESYFNALQGKYYLVEMSGKIEDRKQPIVRIIDQTLNRPDNFNSDTKIQGAGFFSPYLIDSVYDRIKRGEQSILFLNRRGYARVMVCEMCGYEARCPDCAVSYTYSKKNETLSCHLCGSVVDAPQVCPSCQSPEIRYSGVGTEKIENAAINIFKGARIGRMDSDTMKNADAYEETLNKFKRGELDILIGTQMIAKGLHFPNVTLVGIINADLNLAMPDFRAAEKSFQLITQVAGRAGRGEIQGEVIIQTYNPDNETIRFAAENDFKSFYEYDMAARKIMKFPPYGHLMILHFRSEDEMACADYAERFKNALTPLTHPDMKMSGPMPAPIERIKGKYRYILMIRGEKLKQIREYIRKIIFEYPHPKNVEVYLDVDAQSML